MRVGQGSLKNILLSNVAEIRFLRRAPKPGDMAFRRMLCTNSVSLLRSRNGYKVLNYRNPRFTPKFNPAAADIVITWDIFKQDFRCVSLDQCELIRTIPADDTFWEYFNEYILKMTPAEKESFIHT